MSEDLSDLMGKLNNIINSDSSGDLKNIVNEFMNNSSKDNSSNNNQNASSSINEEEENSNFNIDMDTILKMKNVMNAMNTKKNDPRANLLLSLKPYLKESRKNKLDQYVQLMNMGNIFEILKDSGGDFGAFNK